MTDEITDQLSLINHEVVEHDDDNTFLDDGATPSHNNINVPENSVSQTDEAECPNNRSIPEIDVTNPTISLQERDVDNSKSASDIKTPDAEPPPVLTIIGLNNGSNVNGIQPSAELDLSRVSGLCIVLLSSVLYCTSIALAKQLAYLSSSEIASVQCGISLIILTLIIQHRGIKLLVSKEHIKCLVVICITGVAGLLITIYCVQHMKFGDAILLLYLAPLFAGFFAKITFKERFGVVNFTSGFACLLGILFLMQPHMVFSKYAESNKQSMLNCLLAIGGAISLGICHIAIRLTGSGISQGVYLFWINFMLLPASVGVQLMTREQYKLPHCGLDRVWLLGSGILMLSSLYLFTRVLARDVTVPSVLMRNLDVVLGYMYQVLWFDQEMNVLSIIGVTMLVGGVCAVFIHRLVKPLTCNSTTNYVQISEAINDEAVSNQNTTEV